MRPLCLKGHERSITKIRYNREGDLLFSASKDKSPCVWFAENGERLGTYEVDEKLYRPLHFHVTRLSFCFEGHNGVVWCLDVSYDSSKLVTGSGDNYCILWDTEIGRPLHNIQSPTSVRTVGFSYSANLFFFGTDARATMPCEVNIFDLRDSTQMSNGQPSFRIPTPKSKTTSALWGHLDNMIITGKQCSADYYLTDYKAHFKHFYAFRTRERRYKSIRHSYDEPRPTRYVADKFRI